MISAFASAVGIPVGITNSAVWLNICVITSGIKNCKSIIKKKRKEHDQIVFLATNKRNSIDLLISEALLDLYISHDEFISINVLKEYGKIKAKWEIQTKNKCLM